MLSLSWRDLAEMMVMIAFIAMLFVLLGVWSGAF